MTYRAARVGLIGAGDISRRYIETLAGTGLLVPAAIASAGGASAKGRAQDHGLRAGTVDDLLSDPEIDLVLNLAPPLRHFDLTRRALLAGKHVYSEKPLAGSLDEARCLQKIAEDAGLLLACAPATFLGPSLQTARHLVDRGALGDVGGARLSLVYPGPDLWHHNPDHLFDRLGGPLFDMGVYHVSALVALLGPVGCVQAMGSRARSSRTIQAGPRAGASVPVRTNTHLAATMRLTSGALASALFSFDGFGSRAPGLELFGTKAALAVAQPSQFDSEVSLSRRLTKWESCTPSISGWSDTDWAIGPVEAWTAHTTGRTPRTSSSFASHILEVLIGIEQAAITGDAITMRTAADRPAPLLSNYSSTLWAAAEDGRAF